MNHLALQRRIVREGSLDFGVDDYFAFLHISQRPSPDRWESFRRDMRRVRRFLRALPETIGEHRLADSVARLQRRLHAVTLFEKDPRECYRAFSHEVDGPSYPSGH